MFTLFIFLSTFLFGCTEPETSSTTTWAPTPVAPVSFDAAKATTRGKEYINTLYSTKSPNGPVCLGEKVSGEYTQCSYTYTENDGILKAGTILCSTTGCMEGSAATTIDKSEVPLVASSSGTSNSVTDDWLFWYILFNSGGTTHHYHSWYDTTPSYGRTAYYSPGYTPSSQSRNYYTTTYSKPVSTASAKYNSKTSYSSTRSSSSTASSSTATKSSSKSSGWGNSSRSSGYRSSGSSSSRSSGRR